MKAFPRISYGRSILYYTFSFAFSSWNQEICNKIAGINVPEIWKSYQFFSIKSETHELF